MGVASPKRITGSADHFLYREEPWHGSLTIGLCSALEYLWNMLDVSMDTNLVFEQSSNTI